MKFLSIIIEQVNLCFKSCWVVVFIFIFIFKRTLYKQTDEPWSVAAFCDVWFWFAYGP